MYLDLQEDVPLKAHYGHRHQSATSAGGWALKEDALLQYQVKVSCSLLAGRIRIFCKEQNPYRIASNHRPSPPIHRSTGFCIARAKIDVKAAVNVHIIAQTLNYIQYFMSPSQEGEQTFT